MMVPDATFSVTGSAASAVSPSAASVAAQGPTAVAGDDGLVPTVFRWDHGGRQVFITGTFNQWSSKVQMVESGGTFTYIQKLPRAKHAYKFIVDDEWRFAPDQPTVADTAGNINNYIDLTTFRPDAEVIPSRNATVPNLPYATYGIDDEAFTKEPPALPPHLRHITLNAPPFPDSTHLLPVPQPVTMNHLYCTTIRDKLMVQGVTQRYKSKFVTTVYYSIMPVPSAGLVPAAS